MSITRILVTGAGGQIGYSLLPLLARGEVAASLKNRVHLVMHDLPPKATVMEAVAMELEDCAFPSLEGISIITNPEEAFKNADIAVMLASCPWRKGLDRAALLAQNRHICTAQGSLLAKHAKPSCKVLVVGNPANTNAYICYKNAEGMDPSNFSCLSRLDHNRCIFQIAKKIGCNVSQVRKVAVWGNHSSTQYPDASFAEVVDHAKEDGVPKKVTDHIPREWLENDFVEIIRERVWEVANRRNNTSALSPAQAIVSHLHNWTCGTPKDDWVSMGIVSDGSYGVPKGLFSSFPVTVSKKGKLEIVPDLSISETAKKNLEISIKEMMEELKTAEMI